ncbi:MAG: hypothetical protein KF886_07935 [Candidatus Hydrogenedentes bacterium]|nr:hypothetical protein [Candidatus Hydrogenedentota bacterium]
MQYQHHFEHADDIIAHWRDLVPTLSDPLLSPKYVGFASIAGVTVYELAIKEIFISFSQKKHRIFGHYAESHFSRINGRIRVKDIKEEYIPRFGQKYVNRFCLNVEKKEKDHLRQYKRNIRNSYANMIAWRNQFAHEGQINTTATFDEVVKAYEDGKEIIHCLARSMTR